MRITCTRHACVEKFEADGEKRVRARSSSTANADGEVKLAGDAVVALP